MKKYFISELSPLNHYDIKKELNVNAFEQWLTVVSNKNEYVLLLEKIDSDYPNLKELLFHIPYHQQLIYPIDLIKSADEFVMFNKLGYIYPQYVFAGLTPYKNYDFDSKESKISFLNSLYELIDSLHKNNIYMCGFDTRQIFISDKEVKLRYISQEFHPKNSIYCIPDYMQSGIDKKVLDFYSLYVLTFELMYNWHPYYGNLTEYNNDEDDLYYHFYNEPVFIFDKKDTSNEIGFFESHERVISQWQDTDNFIKRIFDNIFTLSHIENNEGILKDNYKKILEYYKNNTSFKT